MKGDFTRDTFQPNRQYTRVLMEQGRVQLDADWNEQQAIHQQQRETRTTDIVGHCGAPETDPGFEITASGADLLIGAGHFYVDGILCVNEPPAGTSTISIGSQPFAGTPVDLGSINIGLVYLDVWERHITWHDDDRIRERALGGPGTASRSQTVCQVKVLSLQSVPTADQIEAFRTNLRNGQPLALPAWQNLVAARDNELEARTNPAAATKDPCELPPGSGYQGLENYLYRVEIHNGGLHDATNKPTFKWSQNNGMLVVDVESVSGTEIIVGAVGRDLLDSFQGDDWVELIRDANVLDGTPGELLQVARADSHERKITLRSNAPFSLTPAQAEAQNAQLRRWSQGDVTATAAGVEVDDDWLHLENGVEVRFSMGTYRTGDYWLIPARTVTGEIEWPPFDIPNPNPEPRLPFGITHHYCPLAIVSRTGNNWDPPQDLRLIFPPLTNIKASDVYYDGSNCGPEMADVTTVEEALNVLCLRGDGQCTFHVTPDTDLAAVFAAINNNEHAKICFSVGRYVLADTIPVANKGRLLLVGSGPGTELVVSGRESTLAFQNCDYVSIKNLRAVSNTANVAAGNANLRGVLSFVNCGQVDLEDVTLRCGHGSFRAATCVTVRNGVNFIDEQLDNGLVRIRRCHLEVGNLQTGALLVNNRRVQFEDNVVDVVDKPAQFNFAELVASDLRFRAKARRLLVNNIQVGRAAPNVKTNVSLTVGGQNVRFMTDPSLAQPAIWERLILAEIDRGATPAIALNRVADRVLLRDAAVANVVAFRDWFRAVEQEDISIAGQGVVVAGRQAPDVRILNNSIRGALQGIHAGFSHSESQRGTPDTAQTVVITHNTVQAFLPPGSVGERHGIFVGNCDSLLAEGNFLSLRRFSSTSRFTVEGIRVFGFLGNA